MQIFQQTETQLPTFMDDVYRHYLHKQVMIIVADRTTVSGILRDCNGCLLHVEGAPPYPHIYIPYDKVLLLQGAE